MSIKHFKLELIIEKIISNLPRDFSTEGVQTSDSPLRSYPSIFHP